MTIELITDQIINIENYTYFYAILSCMKKHNGIKLDFKTLEQIRTCTVQRVQDGEGAEVVVKALGFA